jgi:23S rRNA pseudouridine1911/1915/1917 synthase
VQNFGRQALHARRLGLVHPASGEEMSWESPLPADMVALLAILAEDAKA